MGKELLRKVKEHFASHRRRKMWRKVVSALACVVVFCTTYALILPAITLEKATSCGKEEHIHAEDCYVQTASVEKALPVCTPESLGIHRHTEDCLDGSGEYICGCSDFVVHRHNASCYDETGALWCPLPERKAHTHSESCYAQPETQTAHAHTDACYSLEQGDLTCAVPEGEGAHTHSEGCYDEGGELACRLEESAGHVHTEECYAWNRVLICELSTEAPEEPAEPVLICEKEEVILHSHTDECFDRDGNRICGQVQVLEHVHTQDCFQTVRTEETAQTLICELEEHTHTQACFPQTAPSEEETVQEDDTQKQDSLTRPGDASILNIPLEDTVEDGGDFGENNALHWELTKSVEGEYTLTISGTGPMPDFGKNNPQPWSAYGEIPLKIIIGDGITYIGADAFSGKRLAGLEIGKGVTKIQNGAFGYCRVEAPPGSTTFNIKIPGNVKKLGAAFQFWQNANVPITYTLEEGIETIASMALHRFHAQGVGQTLRIPSSVISIGTNFCHTASAYEVDSGNPNYFAEDGVLYRKLENGRSELLQYPYLKKDHAFTVPSHVRQIAGAAFGAEYGHMEYLQELTIPNTVENLATSFYRVASLHKLYIADKIKISGTVQYFKNATSLEYVSLPNTYTVIGKEMYFNCKAIKCVTVPAGIVEIGSNSFANMESLERIDYRSANVKTLNKDAFGANVNPFLLNIGREVDALPSEFAQFVQHSNALTFEGPNYFTAAEGSFDSAPAPLNGLSGDIYVDDQGAVYQYDSSAGTATLVYVPSGVTTLTVPASLSLEDGGSCPVTGVGKDALTWAENLESLFFEDPGSFTRLDAYALANCPTLKSVNGETTVEGAQALFPREALGYGVFHNTGLTGAGGSGAFEADLTGQESLKVTGENVTELDISVSSGGTMEWEETAEGVGGYRLLTGDTLKVIASVGNTEGKNGAVYRIYFQLTSPEGSLGIAPGQTYTFDGQVVTCHPTEDPYAVYLEFRPEAGKTISIPVNPVYPSPGTRGGGLTIWGSILTEEQAAASRNRLVPSESGTIQAYWTTEPDTFELKKTSVAPTEMGIVSDGAGGAKPHNYLRWQIQVSRKNDVSTTYGKDYARSVDVTDRMTLPDGVAWKPEVLEVIRGGSIRASGNDLYAGEIRIANISLSDSGLTLSGRSITWDEENSQAVIRWSLRTNSDSAEMNASTVDLYIYPEALTVDMNVIKPEEKATITNTAEGTVHFHYGQDQALAPSTATKPISGGRGTIDVKKAGSNVTYFGEDLTYTVDVYNNGCLTWPGTLPGTYTLDDPLSRFLYIKPENLQKMFEETYGDRLTVTVQNASLGAWNQVTGVDGSASWQTPGNSNMGTDGHTLTLTKTSDGQYQAAVEGGSTVTAATVREALQGVGYGVTNLAQYTCTWVMNGEDGEFTLERDEHRQFSIYATVKDTFQMMSKDWPNEYPVKSVVNFSNQAKVLKPDGTNLKSSSAVNSSVKREAYIDKGVYKGGKVLTNPGLAATGDVLEYRVDFTHYGGGSYEDLPMVDDLYGSQYLLVPTAGNPGLSGLETAADDNGVSYYILKPGTYRNVAVGVDDEGTLLTADSVTVTVAEDDTQVSVGGENQTYTGLHTQIKWYFPTMESGNYRKVVTYHTLVDTGLTGISSTVGNVVWMNDRADTRIFASLWGGGTIIDFEKHIVTEPGSTPALDQLDEDGYSLVGPGESVTYRLTLHNKGEGRYVLPGSKLADALPETRGKFAWVKGGNVTDFRVVITGDGVTAAYLDDWELGKDYMGLLGDRQYIRWPDNASITFTKPSTVYLYFTLTFPVNTDEKATWNEYADALSGAAIDNTMYVYRFPSAVLHDLKETGQVLLQKGVSRMFYKNGKDYYTTGESRLYYNNRDQKQRMVCYYITLYNGGNKRLYLNDLYDQLPKGFSWSSILDPNGKYYERLYTTTKSGLSSNHPSLVDLGNKVVTYRSAKITVSETPGGLRFSFGPGSGSYAVRYDETRRQYYLDRGEAIAFQYMCEIGSAQETEDIATNVIAMPYTDPQETGLSVIPKSSLPITAPEDTRLTDYNDGSRKVQSARQVKADYGFESAGGEENWLVSDVTVRRGSIIPGVTKYTDSYTNVSGVTMHYTNSVGPNDTVNWRVRLHNSGSQSISDYTFTDILPKPYVFVGSVKQKSYSQHGWTVNESTLLTFPSNRTGNEDKINVTFGNQKFEVLLDGTPTDLSGNTSISLKRDDASGIEVLSIRFKGASDSIYEGGHTDITLSAKNPTTSYENTVYTNRALFTPNQQPFSIVEQGSMVRDENGKPVSVENSAPVTVSFGYATGSEKRVTQTDDPTNSAVSTDPEDSTILLPSAEKGITYTLTVDNATDNAMKKLVLIDNLPDVGDHSPFHVEVPRNSAFRVSLAENPGFTVTVTPQDGEPYTLASGDYSVEYSTGTDFGGPQSADWKGEETGTTAAWTSDPTGARAFRVIIRDEEGVKLPPKSKISLTFNARVEGEAAPGSVAWNSFGYHYGLVGTATELEAMPLTVGVRLPGIPALEKQLVDGSGASVAAAKDEAFAFLVYEGEALPPETGTTEEALTAALTAANRKYHRFSITVSAGSGTSGSVFLDDPLWVWQDGGRYTVVELPGSEDYSFRSFSGSGSETYTFTYRASANQDILCKNTFRQWKLSLTKVDVATRQPLGGAVFALYSPEEGDKLPEIPQEYQSLAQETVTRNHTTWYLTGIRETGGHGALEWEELLRDTYYLLEVKAPDGYMTNSDPGQIVRWDDAKAGELSLTVENRMGHELPNSGGAGTTPYTVGGLLLTAVSVLLLYSNRKRRKEDTASS